MHLYGTTPLHLAEVAVTTRYHATRNPKALKREPLTLEQHQASRMIADPFRLFDCCQENDGGAVLLVTSAERARDLRQRPVTIMAGAQGGDSFWGQGLTSQNAPEHLYTTAGHAHLARRLYAMAGIGPADVDVALLYDHFSGMVILQLEDYGFCERGEGGAFVENGGIRWPDGRLPVNTHGGNLSEVYLLGMTHIIEGVRQLRGTSTSQVADAEIALVTAGPSNLPTSSLLLGRGT
jgi:acetyl-CoA acetyltransferase